MHVFRVGNLLEIIVVSILDTVKKPFRASLIEKIGNRLNDVEMPIGLKSYGLLLEAREEREATAVTERADNKE